MNPSAKFVITPSDHVILKEVEFLDKLRKALSFANDNEAILTLGISPTRPDTGYGYIHYGKDDGTGVHKVKQFMEKPDLKTAEKFLSSREYLWNAGIFVTHCKTILKAFDKYTPEIIEILGKGKSKYNTPEEQAFIDQAYPTTPNISVDYAIMEKADNVFTIPANIGWSDLGTWGSLYAFRLSLIHI